MRKMIFDGQREGEEVQFVFRRHFLTAKSGVIFLILMIMIGVGLTLLWPNNMMIFETFLALILVGVLGFLYSYMLWYFSIYIVTNQRIRQISQRGLFKKSVVDLGLDKIQSISYGVSGIRAGLMGYGTIVIQTAVGDLVISMVKNSEKIYNDLQNLINEK
ncbi:MAG: PH domain-containing protein [Candidatus Nanosynbacter sp.]|jgi:conserved domain protein|nr:PH domain-containing protein [Candidatus Nanosynbacter sp.]MBF1035429.1 PH domain-containing protein [Candidatus Nanosynbacter sp.]MCG5125735.1 PH domain-containing protein [Candidatus Saccharibacteria bacterium]